MEEAAISVAGTSIAPAGEVPASGKARTGVSTSMAEADLRSIADLVAAGRVPGPVFNRVASRPVDQRTGSGPATGGQRKRVVCLSIRDVLGTAGSVD